MAFDHHRCCQASATARSAELAARHDAAAHDIPDPEQVLEEARRDVLAYAVVLREDQRDFQPRLTIERHLGGAVRLFEMAFRRRGRTATKDAAVVKTRESAGGAQVMRQCAKIRTPVIVLLVATLCGCKVLSLRPQDVQSLFVPKLLRSEVFGIVAGFGTTFAGLPDLIVMLRRRSSAGMHPRMAAIMCVFQVLWIYYGLLIASRPVILWNMIAVLVNCLTVGAYCYFVRREKDQPGLRA